MTLKAEHKENKGEDYYGLIECNNIKLNNRYVFSRKGDIGILEDSKSGVNVFRPHAGFDEVDKQNVDRLTEYISTFIHDVMENYIKTYIDKDSVLLP